MKSKKIQYSFNILEFKKALRQKRIIELNLGLRELSKEIGISTPTLSRYENGSIPKILHYHIICKWLGVYMDKFISTYKK